jgi:hypothetical protein
VPEQEIFCQLLKNNGWHTIGVEPSEKQKRLQKKGVSFVEETS